MNLIDMKIYQQNISTNLSNWVDTTPVDRMINMVTYDLYENNNPFRKNFDKNDINNDALRFAANTSSAVGAEIFSAFSNPFYLTNKITKVPILYQKVVDTYKNIADKKS